MYKTLHRYIVYILINSIVQVFITHQMTSTFPALTSTSSGECDVSVLVSSAIASGLVLSVFTGIPTLLVGLLIGIQCKKHKKLVSTTSLNIHTENRDAVESTSTPVYEEVKEKTRAIELTHNVAYETVQL